MPLLFYGVTMSEIQTEKLPEENGRLVAEVDLDSGETILVTPLSPWMIEGIIRRAKDNAPDPDPAAFKRLVKGLPEGVETYEPVEMNEDYVKAKDLASKKQRDYIYRAVAEIAVIGVKGETRLQTVNRYAHMIKQINRFMVIPGGTWEAVVLYCLVTTQLDTLKILSAANQVPTVAGVNAAIRFFRIRGRGPGFSGSDRAEITPGTAKAYDLNQLQPTG